MQPLSSPVCLLGPPDIQTAAELKALGRFVAPILYGGLGNVLFQLATVHVLGKQEGVSA